MKIVKSFQCLTPAVFVLNAVLAFGTPAYGQAIPGYPNSIQAHDPREIAMLPPYCIHTMTFSDVPGASHAEHLRYVQTMGQVFEAMHHYCWALMNTNRALYLARDPVVRKYYLDATIADFDYVLRDAKNVGEDNFVLKPELLTKKGENLLRLDRAVEGLSALQLAIDAKPDYWPPYVAMSDHYKKIGDVKKARELLERGLELAPDTKALKTRLAELDAGKSKPRTASESPKKPAIRERSVPENAPPSAPSAETPRPPVEK